MLTKLAPAGPALTVRDPDLARAAHLLRRTSLTVDPARIAAVADRSWDDAVADLLAAAAPVPTEQPPEDEEDWTVVTDWWVQRLSGPESGLRDRMTWFWHNLLTTSAEKVSQASLISEQLVGLRAEALGDYRTLLHGFIAGGALIEYLDANYSLASNPNENLGRELMELFTLGRGNYSEDDVRSASRALAGWVVEDGVVEWRREHAFVAPLLFRGIQDEWDTTKIVDHLCDQPETAVNVAGRLWRDLVGTELEAAAAAELGTWWQSRELSITDLVERILGDPALPEIRNNRVRTGFEWYVAFRSVTGIGGEGIWDQERLGQVPYLPPNVGGWPAGATWLTAGSMLPRASLAFQVPIETVPGGPGASTDDLLDACGLHEVSDTTRQVVDDAASSAELDPDSAALTAWRLALSSPEFSLS